MSQVVFKFRENYSWAGRGVSAQVLRLIQYAGKTQGVGEMRPSAPKKSRDYGQFQIAQKEKA